MLFEVTRNACLFDCDPALLQWCFNNAYVSWIVAQASNRSQVNTNWTSDLALEA